MKDYRDNTRKFESLLDYLFNKDVFSYMPKSQVFSLEHDFFPKMAGSRTYGYVIDEEFFDIGTLERYKRAKRNLPV